MALNKATLKSTIKTNIAAIDIMSGNISDKIIDVICDAVDTYVKAATVTVTVATTGTATAQTGTGTGTLS